MDDNSQYRELFFEETDEHLGHLNDGILELESEPDNRELLDSIFRSAHTLKGMAATMGYDAMAKLTHSMENLFQGFKDQTLQVTSDHISLIFDCLDRLANIVEELRAEVEPDEEAISDLLKRLTNVANRDTVTSQVEEEIQLLSMDHVHAYIQTLKQEDRELSIQALDQNYHCYGIGVQLDQGCVLKGPRVFLVMDKLERDGDVIQTSPHVEDLENGEFGDTFYLLYLTQLEKAKVQELILSNSEIAGTIIHNLTQEELKTPQVVVPKAMIETQPEREEQQETKAKVRKKITEHQQSNHSIRVEVNKLDSFMDLVSELVVYRTRLETLGQQRAVEQLSEPLEQVARITSELQELVLQIRMEQVGTVLKRFPRMVRDLARDLNKEMDLIIEGEETELDRTVVSELSEPLIHLIRNSADHGIEKPEERIALGKPSTGEIKIIAFQQGNRVVLTISDDGKGLDPQLIAASAARKGISTEGMTDQEICHLIFHPGFSTAETVTNVSGRGVGMDAVQSKIAALGGTIELTTEINKGTTFTINLPLTLSIIQSLMVEVSEEVFALPLGAIEKVVTVRPNELVKTHEQEIFFYRGQAIPVVRTNRQLDLPEKDCFAEQHLVIILLGKKYFAVLVDKLIGQQEVVIKKLGTELRHLKKFIGATILGNGEVILILDLNSLCQESQGEQYDNL